MVQVSGTLVEAEAALMAGWDAERQQSPQGEPGNARLNATETPPS